MPATTREAGKPGKSGPGSRDVAGAEMSVSQSTRRFIVTLALSALVFSFSVHAGFAAEPGPKAPSIAKMKELLLSAKDPVTWTIVKGGRGTLIYREATGTFTLNAMGLYPHAPYALIRYADAPPKVEVLARGNSNGRGQLRLAGVWKNWTRKFWLVSGEDVAGKVGTAGAFQTWRPARYLFEEKQLGIPCQCTAPGKL